LFVEPQEVISTFRKFGSAVWSILYSYKKRVAPYSTWTMCTRYRCTRHRNVWYTYTQPQL